MTSESQLLARIYERSRDLASSFGEIVVGPGDDAAVVRAPGGDVLVITTDQLVEGRHYAPETPVDRVARKAIARAISDIAAMGGAPAWGLATGVLPDGYAHGDELCASLARWAEHWRCPLIGGDLAFGSERLVLSVTVIGRMESGHPPVLRSGAKPGDELRLTGPVGASLPSGWHLEFEPRLEQGRAASKAGARVHAMIDLSDGLGRDAGRVARASGVILEIDASAIPLRDPALDWNQACSDGEDYELLMAIAPGPESATAARPHRIGVARACEPGEAPGVYVVDQAGTRHDAAAMGWDHGA